MALNLIGSIDGSGAQPGASRGERELHNRFQALLRALAAPTRSARARKGLTSTRCETAVAKSRSESGQQGHVHEMYSGGRSASKREDAERLRRRPAIHASY